MATHTFVISDIHLADAEPADPRRPLWRRYMRAEHFPDETLLRFLDHICGLAEGARCELVLNGDIFDFDVVLGVPDQAERAELGVEVSWLERARGLNTEEPKSAWKMRRILAAHAPLLAGLREFVNEGHDVIFVIGNHDMELHWPAVQQALRDALAVSRPEGVRICAWFYRAGDDTLVTHGHQLDPYCLTPDPLHPLIDVGGTRRVRLPFGDQAAKFLTNGIGWFNPHVAETYVRPLGEWVLFFYRVVARQQPLIFATWLWSAVAALVVSLTEAARPALRDPRTLERRLQETAERSRATPGMVLALRELRAHPATAHPWKVARELWLDRAFLLALVGVASFQIIASLHLVAGVHPAWVALVLVCLLVPFLFYARSVDSDVAEVESLIRDNLSALAEVARVDRAIMGHTHGAVQETVDGVAYFNTGHWAPGFHDLECTRPHGVRGFAWVAPSEVGARTAQLRRWDDPGSVRLDADGGEDDARADSRPPATEQVA